VRSAEILTRRIWFGDHGVQRFYISSFVLHVRRVRAARVSIVGMCSVYRYLQTLTILRQCMQDNSFFKIMVRKVFQTALLGQEQPFFLRKTTPTWVYQHKYTVDNRFDERRSVTRSVRIARFYRRKPRGNLLLLE